LLADRNEITLNHQRKFCGTSLDLFQPFGQRFLKPMSKFIIKDERLRDLFTTIRSPDPKGQYTPIVDRH
jgi:hypothetical protein